MTTKTTKQIVTTAADTTVLPVSTMTRDQMLRQAAAIAANRVAVRVEHARLTAPIDAAAIAAGQAELAIYGIETVEVSTSGKQRRVGRRFSNDATITVISTAHKMKEGAVNLRRFLALHDAATVRDAHRLGVDNGYLAYYVRNGLITITA